MWKTWIGLISASGEGGVLLCFFMTYPIACMVNGNKCVLKGFLYASGTTSRWAENALRDKQFSEPTFFFNLTNDQYFYRYLKNNSESAV